MTCLWSMITDENEMENLNNHRSSSTCSLFFGKLLVIVGLLTVTGVWYHFWIPKKMKKLKDKD